MYKALGALKWSLRSWLRGRRKFQRIGWIAGRFRIADGTPWEARWNDRERAYYVYVPQGLTRQDRVPLLVMLHGCKQDARVFAEGTRMNRLADLHRFIVLYPEQSTRANLLGCWRWFDRETLNGAGDARLIAGIIRRVIARYPVDRSRVYIAGISAGGAMASILVFTYGAMFAACGIVSGVMYRAADSVGGALAAMSNGSRVEPRVAAAKGVRSSAADPGFVPALIMHGDSDSTVHPINADQTVQQFRALAELSSSPGPLVEGQEVRVVGQDRAYRQRDYLGGNERVLLRKLIIEGLGHAWSGGDARHEYNDPAAPDASRLIWDFVSEFRR